MTTETAKSLMQGALEKIVYFEARSGQLQREAQSSRAERDRLAEQLARAAEREIELKQKLAATEVALGRANAARDELAALNLALRREQDQLMGSMLESAAVRSEDREGGLDLARFISRLRSEASHRRPAEPAVVPAPKATKFQAEPEPVLVAAMAELTSPAASTRARAAARLGALGNRRAALAVSAALKSETDAEVQAELLRALPCVAGREAVATAAYFLRAPTAALRLLALSACLKLDPSSAGQKVVGALSDPDASVRRRATLMALGLPSDDALALGKSALADGDPEVRRVAVLVLGANLNREAEAILIQATQDADAEVRDAASRALFGKAARDLDGLGEAARRRLTRRLLNARLAAAPTVSARQAVLGELRANLLGRDFDELVAASGGDELIAAQACEELVLAGAARRRGAKYFAA